MILSYKPLIIFEFIYLLNSKISNKVTYICHKSFRNQMQSQVSKIRLISMFYLAVFTSALLLSGILGGQHGLLGNSKGKPTSMVFATSPDSIHVVKGINVSAEPGSGSEDINEQDNKHNFIPLDFNFGFNSLLQWFFRLPLKNLSQANPKSVTPTQQALWLTIHNLRI